MTTFLGIVRSLPPRLVASRARLQLAIAWANILLQRRAATESALTPFTTAVARGNLDATAEDLHAEASVIRAVAEIFSDRVGAVSDLVAETMSRPDTLHPLLAVAGNLAAFAAIYRFEFDTAHRLLEWAAAYQEMVGPFARVYARCFAGIAARYQLDIPSALSSFRRAFEIGTRVGPHSHAARLAGALLGELLYEAGEVAEATRLLDESYRLGPEGGGVDYMVARYVVGARIKAAQGNRDAAVNRLAAGMKAAVQLRLPRLAAAINNERIRLGVPIMPAVAVQLRAPRTIPAGHDGIAIMTAELDEDSGIRLLAASESAHDRQQACRGAADLRAGIDATRRPLAALRAHLLLVEVLAATGRPAQAAEERAAVFASCAGHGLPRLLADAHLA
jgi:serine/threonine-protein kinase PknK